MGATVVGESTVRYVPHGLTIAVFLAESHIVLTTWPEHRLLLIARPSLMEVQFAADDGRGHETDGEERAQALADGGGEGDRVEGGARVEALRLRPAAHLVRLAVFQPAVGIAHLDPVPHVHDVGGASRRRRGRRPSRSRACAGGCSAG